MADAADTLGADDPGFERFRLGCYVGGRIEVDGELYGTLCFAGGTARERSFGEDERTLVRLMVEWLGRELERERYQRELEVARERLEQTFERIDDGFFAVDDGWTVTYANATGADLLRSAMGLDDGTAVVGRHLWEEIPAATDTVFHERYHEAMASQQPVTFEAQYGPLDAWFEVSAYPSPDGLSVFFKDVTERRRREDTLTGLLATAREMTTADTPETIAELAVEAAVDLLDEPLAAVRLYDPETGRLEVAAVSDAGPVELPDRPPYEVGEWPVGEAFERGEPVVVEADRGIGDVESALYLPLEGHGVLTLAATVPGAFGPETRRVGELLAANAAAAMERADRQLTLRRYEAVVENVRGMVYVVDGDGRVVLATKPFAEALDRDREALVGTDIAELFDETGRLEHRAATEMLGAGYADASSFEAACVPADGDPFPVAVELSRLPGQARGGYVGVVRDISALAETRHRLESQSDRFQHLFESIPEPVNEVEFVDGEPLVRSANRAFEETFGYDLKEIRGENLDDYIVPTDEQAAADRLDSRARERGTVTSEVRRRIADGLRTFLFRGVTCEVDGHRFGFGLYTDITEQKERQHRLEVLHTVLRHNLRTEMTVMQGYAEQLREQFDQEPAALSGLRESIASVGDLSSKVREVETAVKDGRGNVEPTDIVPVVERAARLGADAHPTAAVELSLPDAARAIADDRLEVAVRNLIDNAVEHSDRDEPVVSVTVDPGDQWVAIRVADDGPGIPDRERELVAGERDITQLEHGSGLGLWLANWLVRAYGGDLRFEAREPRGQVVVLRLPAGDAPVSRP